MSPIRVIPFLVALMAGSPTESAGAVTLTADAGLNGICRPGRWAPVRVTVENHDADFIGDLVVEWGHARVSRAVTIPSPSRRYFELYIRAGDVRDVMTVRLVSTAGALRVVEAPVRFAGADELVTACIDSMMAPEPGGADCTTTLKPDALPRSWRGYDMADRVVSSADAGVLQHDQRRALQLWRALRWAEDSGHWTQTTGAVPSPGRAFQHATLAISGYLLTIGLIGIAFHRYPLAPRTLYPSVVAAILVGAAGALASGRTGASPVVVHHASLVHQFADLSEAVFSMRAVAEYPAFDSFVLRAESADAAIDVLRPEQDPPEEQFDEDGYPVLRGLFGLGSTKAFSVEGISSFRVFDASSDGDVVRVTNASSSELHDCEFPRGFGVPGARTLRPGESLTGALSPDDADPVITCTLEGAPIDLSVLARSVVTNGTTSVTYHLVPVPAS